MKREYLAFLLAGLAFGILVGLATANAMRLEPALDLAGESGAAGAPRGPQAPTQMSGGPVPPDSQAQGGAPMVAEINALKAKLQQEPENLQVLARLANIYHDAGMWEQAVGYYERAVALRPNDPNLITDLGVCLRGLGRFDRALQAFEQAHALDPKHWQSLFNQAVVATFDLGRKDLALKAIEAMKAIEPRPAELTADLARLEQALQARVGSAPTP